MYTDKNLLPLKIVQRNNSIKPELASVAFYGNRTVATDSFRLMEVSAFGEAEPVRTVHRDKLKFVKIKKGEMIGSDKIEEQALQPLNPHGTYPDIDIVLREDKGVEYATIKVNGHMLGELLQQMAKMNKFGHVELNVPIDSPYKAIRITAGSHEGSWEGEPGSRMFIPKQRARGLMMPLSK
jgi:hypothetical protein